MNLYHTLTAQEASTLAKRAARFHAYKSARACVRQAQKDPEAWALYVAWHESHHAPEGVTPEEAVAAIAFYIGTEMKTAGGK